MKAETTVDCGVRILPSRCHHVMVEPRAEGRPAVPYSVAAPMPAPRKRLTRRRPAGCHDWMDAQRRLLQTRDEIREFLRVVIDLDTPVELSVEWSKDRGDHVLQRVVYPIHGGDQVPAFLLRPHDPHPSRPGFVVYHQHASQWHLGKSEVIGLAGDPLQALGLALVSAGAVVLAPDSICFEDRRRTGPGTDLREDDPAQHDNELTYRLVRGDTLARKVIQDAVTAVSALTRLGPVNPGQVGAIGHSYGGTTVLFTAAIDQRIAFACASGAAGTYRSKLDNEIGLERALVIPGVVAKFDIDTLVSCIAPRPLLLVAGEEDKYALDAGQVARGAASAYEAAAARAALTCLVRPGGHALTAERYAAICQWAKEMMNRGAPI